jgi:hypothetical protein
MSSAIEVPERSTHHRRPEIWPIVAFVAAFDAELVSYPCP